MIYVIFIALVLVAFLVDLNGFLRGAKKAQIDVALSFLLVGLIITTFFLSGWKLGLMAILVTFLSAVITRPLAARLASRLLGMSTDGRGEFVGLPSGPLQIISQQLGKPFDPSKAAEELFSYGAGKDAAVDSLLDYCEKQPAIQALLNEFHVSRNNLRELYYQLLAMGAGQWVCGHWVAASALAHPQSLRYLLNQRDTVTLEIAVKVIMHFEHGAPLSTLDS
jgi:hypothetical protein